MLKRSCQHFRSSSLRGGQHTIHSLAGTTLLSQSILWDQFSLGCFLELPNQGVILVAQDHLEYPEFQGRHKLELNDFISREIHLCPQRARSEGDMASFLSSGTAVSGAPTALGTPGQLMLSTDFSCAIVPSSSSLVSPLRLFCGVGP